jgi:hypothetical protein
MKLDLIKEVAEVCGDGEEDGLGWRPIIVLAVPAAESQVP